MLLVKVNVLAESTDMVEAAWLPKNQHQKEVAHVTVGQVVIWLDNLGQVERLRDALTRALETAAAASSVLVAPDPPGDNP